MFNTTGCADAFARDDLLVPSSLPDFFSACFVSLPAYYILLLFFAIILSGVAFARTKLVQVRTKRMRLGQKVGSSLTARLSPAVVLFASWSSVCVLALFLIVPLAVSPLNNSLIFLIGVQYACFNILSERWLMKLVRLGSKIIMGGSKKDNSSSSSGVVGEEHLKAMDYLNRSDNVLVVLHTLIIVGLVFQFICLCVLSMIFTDTSLFVRIGIGMQGFNIFIPMCAIIWQYQRCTTAILASSKTTKNLAQNGGRNQALESVVLKFRRHQIILAIFGIPGSLVFLLWGVSVFQVSFVVIIINSFLDAFVNCGVLVTFIKRRPRKNYQDTTHLVSGSMFNQNGGNNNNNDMTIYRNKNISTAFPSQSAS